MSTAQLQSAGSQQPLNGHQLAQGRQFLSIREESNLRYAYEMFDDDRSGDLSQGEIIKLLQRLNVVGNKDEAILMMRRMDVNNDGSVDVNEFIDFFDTKFLATNTMTEAEFRATLNVRCEIRIDSVVDSCLRWCCMCAAKTETWLYGYYLASTCQHCVADEFCDSDHRVRRGAGNSDQVPFCACSTDDGIFLYFPDRATDGLFLPGAYSITLSSDVATLI